MPDTIAGLPLHPLVVHVAVVLLPLSALGLLIVLLLPRARRTYGWLPVLGLALSTVAAWVAKETGQNLSEVIGVPQDHADWGSRLVPISAALFVVAALWYWRIRKGASGAITGVLAVASALLSVIAIVVVVVVGHSGAEAAWASKYAAATSTEVVQSTEQTVTPTATPAPSVPSSAAATSSAPASAQALTLAAVAQHNQASDCWAAVNSNVYDLTDWINKHPGGAAVITSLCGTDATQAFKAQHGGQSQPESELRNYLLGALQ